MDIEPVNADPRQGKQDQDDLFNEISLIVDRAGPWRLVSSWLWQASLGQEALTPIQADPSYFSYSDLSAAPVLLWRRPIEPAKWERAERVGPGFVVNVEIDRRPAGGPADTLPDLSP